MIKKTKIEIFKNGIAIINPKDSKLCDWGCENLRNFQADDWTCDFFHNGCLEYVKPENGFKRCKQCLIFSSKEKSK